MVLEGVAVPAFDELFPQLYATGYRAAFRLLGDRAEAEDVAQEALARAYVRWRRVSAYAEPWVTRVATNLALDRVRRRRRAPEADRPGTVSDSHSAERVDLVRALHALPRRQREVVVLRYLADHSEESVAALLGCSVGSVKTHASRGLAALRLRLGDVTVGS